MTKHFSQVMPAMRLAALSHWSFGAMVIAALGLLPIVAVFWIALHPTEVCRFPARIVRTLGQENPKLHRELMARMGFEKESLEGQELFMTGKREEAVGGEQHMQGCENGSTGNLGHGLHREGQVT